jgi:hypothetical protein
MRVPGIESLGRQHKLRSEKARAGALHVVCRRFSSLKDQACGMGLLRDESVNRYGSCTFLPGPRWSLVVCEV